MMLVRVSFQNGVILAQLMQNLNMKAYVGD
jgi:hypothetical protein